MCRNLTISSLILDQHWLVKYSLLIQTIKEYLCRDYPDSFALLLTNPQEVMKATNELANKTSAGYDNVSVNLIKKIIHHIAEPLSALINKSFECGIVPDQLKIARVCPIIKSGDQTDFTNYRPISVFASILKNI